MASDYEASLDSTARSRYRQKLGVVGCECPYSIPLNAWKNNPREWPLVEYADVFHYLIDTPGIYCRDSKSDYKSLRAKTLLDSGFVQIVKHHKIQDTGITVFRADVIPSYRTTSKPHQPWVAVASTGYIVTAHCDCKAGLGESCTHVGGLLYKIEKTCTMGLTRPETCTDLPCVWNNVEWGGVKPGPLSEISLYSNEIKASISQKNRPAIVMPKVQISEERKMKFFSDLLDSGALPVCLSLYSATASRFVSTKPVPVAAKIPRPLPDLIKQAPDHQVPTIQPRDLQMVEEMTKEQSNSIIWHDQRTGRITSTAVHSILHTNPTKPAKSLITKITSSRPAPCNAAPLKWGRDHEKDAVELYKDTLQATHQNLQIKDSGLVIHPDRLILATSPDGIVSCDCCGKGVIKDVVVF